MHQDFHSYHNTPRRICNWNYTYVFKSCLLEQHHWAVQLLNILSSLHPQMVPCGLDRCRDVAFREFAYQRWFVRIAISYLQSVIQIVQVNPHVQVGAHWLRDYVDTVGIFYTFVWRCELSTRGCEISATFSTVFTHVPRFVTPITAFLVIIAYKAPWETLWSVALATEVACVAVRRG